MPKIPQYPNIDSLLSAQVFLVDGAGKGTKTIQAGDLLKALFLVTTESGLLYDFYDAQTIPVEQRRNIFRGKNLGSTFTAGQKAQITAGTFKDLFIGDYWTIDNAKWRIADINYWFNTGDTNCKQNHLVIVPDKSVYTARMNSINTTDGGYTLSEMRTENLENAKTLINGIFGSDNILSHREYLCNAMDVNGYQTGYAWYNSDIELMNEIMLYGKYMHILSMDNKKPKVTNASQLSLFKMYPEYIGISRQVQWLRDPLNNTQFSCVNFGGFTNCVSASDVYGVRPVFGLTGGS